MQGELKETFDKLEELKQTTKKTDDLLKPHNNVEGSNDISHHFIPLTKLKKLATTVIQYKLYCIIYRKSYRKSFLNRKNDKTRLLNR